LTSPKVDEKLVCLEMVARCERRPGQMLILIGDKNFRGQQFEADLAALDATIQRPRRKDEPGRGPHLAPIRQRIESIFWTAKDILTFERHGAAPSTTCASASRCASPHSPPRSQLNHRLGPPATPLPATPHNPAVLI
jgi:hypothetical protein